jgi:hypothetical protein
VTSRQEDDPGTPQDDEKFSFNRFFRPANAGAAQLPSQISLRRVRIQPLVAR